MAKRKPKTGYTPEVCNQVVTLMGTGLSLTAAAGLMGFSCATINSWMDKHEEFKEAVARGKAARVFFLESKMLTSENTAVINACRFALMNAAPEEWSEKPAVETAEDPIRLLAQQISGRALRPRLPETKIIEHEPVMPSVTQPPNSEIIDDADDDDRPRVHTVSREIYEDEG
jgi:hypothetical protein